MFSSFQNNSKSNSSNKVDPLASIRTPSPPPAAPSSTGVVGAGAAASSSSLRRLQSNDSIASINGNNTNKKHDCDHPNNPPFQKKESNIDIRKKKIKDGKLSIAFVWITSIAMAMSLFQIMTYEPDLHNHHHHHSIHQRGGHHSGHDSTTATAEDELEIPPHPMSHMIDHSEWKLAHKDRPKKRPSYNFERNKNEKQQQQPASSASSIPKAINTTQSSSITTTLSAIKANKDGMVVLSDVIAQDASWADNPLVQVMQQAKITEIALDDFQQLPAVTHNLQHLYHRTTSSTLTDPNIIGLDTCQYYRDVVAPNVKDRYTSAAGMFNTGTNALTFALEHNVQSQISPKMPWQVPWGKHRMEYRRLHHIAPGLNVYNQTQCLPVVIIRDPFAWMQSMCKNPYAAHWRHHPKLRCPNLVPNEKDRHRWTNLTWDGGTTEENAALESFPVKVIYDEHDVAHYESLVGLWSDWYRPYLNATYPRIMIRFEDFLLQAPLILQRISECMGLPPVAIENYKTETNSAKAHGSGTTFLKAIIKSGNAATRSLGLTRQDLDYAAQHLDAQLMNTFHYHVPDDE